MRAKPTIAARVLDGPTWRAREQAHQERVDRLTAGHAQRRREGRPHPVEDFLFTYYSLPVGRLRRWHPGAEVVLLDAPERATWRWYRGVDAETGGGSSVPGVAVDVTQHRRDRGDAIGFVAELLTATAARPAQLGCFGLHEWAMVYRRGEADVRHADWPLRLGPRGTDEVVEAAAIRCSHYDAYRFFTPEALGRNVLRPTRASQVALEQPGCLHATMDLYKWAYKLGPLAPGELLLDCFELARDVRVLDMRASPYDLSALGYSPVKIETPEGKAEYVAAQRAFADRGEGLRGRLLRVVGDQPGSSASGAPRVAGVAAASGG